MADKWSVGSVVGRTLYLNDRLVGLVDSTDIADKIVSRMNAAELSTSPEVKPQPPVTPAPIVDPNWVPTPNPKRITKAYDKGYVINEYSTVSAFNCNNTAFLLIYPGGFFWLYDRYGEPYMQLPAEVNASSCPRWSKTNPAIFTYFNGNKLKQFDTSKSFDGPAMSVIHTFNHGPYNFTSVNDGGEADISEDGDHRVIVGDSKVVFVYQLSRDTVFTPSSITNYNPTYSAYITPDNNVLVGSKTAVNMYTKDMQFIRTVVGAFGHMDVGRDNNGDEILVWINADENPVTLTNCANGIIKVKLADKTQTGLLCIGWSPLGGPSSLAVNISCPDKSGFALASIYGKDPNSKYNGKIVKMFYDGSAPQIICDHGSKVIAGSDNSQPKVSISRDGKMYLYRSNGGVTVKPDFADVWMGAIV